MERNQCFKTRTGPAGRPGTRPTRAWWRQKPARELARWNPVDPEGRPGTRTTRSNPVETRSIFFLDWLMLNDVVLAFVLEAKTTKNNEAELGILITDYRANLIKKHINFNRWAEEQRRAEDRRRLDHCCFTAKKVSFLFLFTNLLLSLSLFFILGRVLNLQFWASFCCSLIQSRWFSCSPVISTSGMFLCSFFSAA